jgi:hypothetical protein
MDPSLSFELFVLVLVRVLDYLTKHIPSNKSHADKIYIKILMVEPFAAFRVREREPPFGTEYKYEYEYFGSFTPS